MWIAIRTKKTHELNNNQKLSYNIHAQMQQKVKAQQK